MRLKGTYEQMTYAMEKICDSLVLTSEELDLVLGGSSNPSVAQVDLPGHAEHVAKMAAGGAAIGGAIGTGIGLATGGPLAAVPTGAAGAAIGGMVGTAIGVGYEVYEHREAIAAGAQVVGEGASGVYDSAVSYGQQFVGDVQQFGQDVGNAANAAFAEHGHTLYTSISQQNGF